MSLTDLNTNHPSFGTNQSWFQFAITSNDGVIRKLLLVEAKCPAAIATIEQILSKDDKVSKHCSIVAVLRECPNIGMRSNLVDECSYVDFMLDIVEPDRIINDEVVGYYFRKSLTEPERLYAAKKAAFQAKAESEKTVKGYYDTSIASLKTKTAGDDDRVGMIQSALTNMGFQKAPVKKWVTQKGSDIQNGSVADQIRDALRVLSS